MLVQKPSTLPWILDHAFTDHLPFVVSQQDQRRGTPRDLCPVIRHLFDDLFVLMLFCRLLPIPGRRIRTGSRVQLSLVLSPRARLSLLQIQLVPIPTIVLELFARL
jgi:hypothetical protein